MRDTLRELGITVLAVVSTPSAILPIAVLGLSIATFVWFVYSVVDSLAG